MLTFCLRRGKCNVVKVSISGLEDGSQVVVPEASTNSEVSVLSSEMILKLQLQLQVATVREVRCLFSSTTEICYQF